MWVAARCVHSAHKTIHSGGRQVPHRQPTGAPLWNACGPERNHDELEARLDALRSVAPTRRGVLAGSVAMLAALGSAAGCTSVSPAEAPTPGPEVTLLDGVIQNEAALLALYDAVLTAHQELGGRLKPLREHHTQHLAVLKRHYVPGSTTGTATPAPQPTATAPPTQAAALRAIRTAERKAANARAGEVRHASPGLSQLLAAIGACEAGHAQELT